MLEQLKAWHSTVNGWVWGPVTMALLVGTGLFLTVLTRGVQFRLLPTVLREVLGRIFQRSRAEGTVTPSRRWRRRSPPRWASATSPASRPRSRSGARAPCSG